VFLETTSEIEALNGLRAISITGILLEHLWLIVEYHNIPRPHLVNNLFHNFVNFIDLFFVLSGFLIYGGLSKQFEKEKRIQYANYFKKRTLRIFPAYYFFVFLMYLFAYVQIKALSGKPSLTDMEFNILTTLKARISNPYPDLLYVSNYLGGNITHNWSLAIEEQFYIILPFFLGFFLFKLKREFRLNWLILLYFLPILMRLYLVITSTDMNKTEFYIYDRTHTRFDSLFVGIIVYEIYSLNHVFYQKLLNFKPLVYMIITSFLSLAFLAGKEDNSFFYSTFKYNLSNIAFGLLLLIALDKTTSVSKFLSFPAFRPIARISYTAYLWHIVFGGALFGALINIKHFSWLRYSYACLVAIALTFFMSWIMFSLVEYPFLKKKMEIA
jgi:peptidoglycan/LPS O-acetylase OafA/YrhL